MKSYLSVTCLIILARNFFIIDSKLKLDFRNY